MKYETWMTRVDALLISIVGLGSRNLPDECWRDQYDDGFSPEQALENIYGGADFGSIAGKIL